MVLALGFRVQGLVLRVEGFEGVVWTLRTKATGRICYANSLYGALDNRITPNRTEIPKS